MRDDTPQPKSGPLPPLPSSGTTGRLPSPTTHLPPIKKGGAGKIVVMLSSVAKPAPAGTQSLPRVPPLAEPAPKFPPVDPAKDLRRPPPPRKEALPESPPLRLSATTHVKLPPKTSVPQLGSLSGAAMPAPAEKESPAARIMPPPLPAKWTGPVRSEPKKPGAQHIPPIKLNEPAEPDSPAESIFLNSAPDTAEPQQKPEGSKNPAPAAETGEPVHAPALRSAEPAESGVLNPLQVPPLLPEKAAELPTEKLRQPHLPTEAREDKPRSGDVPGPSDSPEVAKAPPLIGSEPAAPEKSLQPLSAKPLLPPSRPIAKATGPGGWFKKSIPLVFSSSSGAPPKIEEAKPALKPPILSKRSLAQVAVGADTQEPKPSAEPEPASKEPESSLPVNPTPSAVAAAPPASPEIPIVPKKAPLPPTRAARAKKRRWMGTIVFYLLLVLTLLVLFFGGLYFGRETRVEGQVIPPPGMVLNDEVWIVTDFSSLANGIAEDLAAERTPLMQEIQERQEHVQRAQADVASREERIRLIQEEIQTSKDEIAGIGKQSRDATQQIWDGEGAQIDAEYASRLDQLQKAIADRAKSLNLKYEPDDTYKSPEVWANAYRLALYEVPPGIDSVKEHQWLGDQMKQWRDFLKTLDDRKAQLRDKAALIKTSSGPKVTDLQAKIDDAQQRADAAAAEEVPLKAELEQAQADLVQAQTTDAGLDEKYYKQLDALPGEATPTHIPLLTNGRFSWLDDNVFAEGEKEHRYWIFARATRADGRQYWALHPFTISKNQTVEIIIEPAGFISTKAILRPNLSPEEQEQ